MFQIKKTEINGFELWLIEVLSFCATVQELLLVAKSMCDLGQKLSKCQKFKHKFMTKIRYLMC